MSKKILTDELIATRLRKANVLEPGGLEHDYMLKCVQDYYEFKITNEWGNPDIMFYTETTSDGYEVWIATDNDRNPSICDDVYYYDTDGTRDWSPVIVRTMTSARWSKKDGINREKDISQGILVNDVHS